MNSQTVLIILTDAGEGEKLKVALGKREIEAHIETDMNSALESIEKVQPIIVFFSVNLSINGKSSFQLLQQKFPELCVVPFPETPDSQSTVKMRQINCQHKANFPLGPGKIATLLKAAQREAGISDESKAKQSKSVTPQLHKPEKPKDDIPLASEQADAMPTNEEQSTQHMQNSAKPVIDEHLSQNANNIESTSSMQSSNKENLIRQSTLSKRRRASQAKIDLDNNYIGQPVFVNSLSASKLNHMIDSPELRIDGKWAQFDVIENAFDTECKSTLETLRSEYSIDFGYNEIKPSSSFKTPIERKMISNQISDADEKNEVSEFLDSRIVTSIGQSILNSLERKSIGRPIGSPSVMGIMPIVVNDISGCLLIELGATTDSLLKEKSHLFETIFDGLSKHYDINSIGVFPITTIPGDQLDYERFAKRNCIFKFSGNSQGKRIFVGFFEDGGHISSMIQLAMNVNENALSPVAMGRIQPDTRLNFSGYLWMQKNNKPLEYFKAGGYITSKQMLKFQDRQINQIHIQPSELEQFIAYVSRTTMVGFVEETFETASETEEVA